MTQVHPDRTLRSQLAAETPTRLHSLRQAAHRTSTSEWTWRKWAATGRIATVKLGARVPVSEAEIERIIAAGTRPARPEAQ